MLVVCGSGSCSLTDLAGDLEGWNDGTTRVAILCAIIFTGLMWFGLGVYRWVVVDRRRKNSLEISLRRALQEHLAGPHSLSSAERVVHLMRLLVLPHASQFVDMFADSWEEFSLGSGTKPPGGCIAQGGAPARARST